MLSFLCGKEAQIKVDVTTLTNESTRSFDIYLFFTGKETVDNADLFPEVLCRFEQWLDDHELGTKYKFGVVTDG